MKHITLLSSALFFLTLSAFAQITMTCNSSYSSVNDTSFTWEDNVVLTAERITGEVANVIYDNEFADKGFGISGARWKQIDFYQDYQGFDNINASEKLIINFNGTISNLVITVGMMGLNEGIGSDDETGKWTAYDSNDNEIGTGEFGPAESELGVDTKISGSYGKYPFSINAGQPIAKLVVESTGFGYNGPAGPKYVSGYNNDSGNQENNSDFNLFRLSYNRETLSTTDVLESNISIYPNPVNDKLTISLNNADVKQINIFDVSGKKIKKVDHNEFQIDVSDLESGIYLLSIKLMNGRNNYKKIVKL